MNKQKFVNLLRQPSLISESNLTELEELAGENPYFHSVHTVIARASKLLRSKESNRRVNTAAIYATSRKALKKYIQGSTEFLSGSNLIIESDEEVSLPTVSQEIQEEKVISPELTSNKSVIDATISDQPRIPLSQSDHASLIDEVYDNIEEWKKSKNHFLEYEMSLEGIKLNKKVVKDSSVVDIIKSKIAKEIIEEEEEVAQAMQGIKKGASKSEKTTTSQTTSSLGIKTTKTIKKKTTDSITEAKTKPVKTSVKKTKTPTAQKILIKKSSKTSSTIDNENSASPEDEKKKPKQIVNQKLAIKENQNKLIDKFITNSPSIQTGKLKDFGTPNLDLSEKNNEFPTDIVTENMANIFESQGKPDKAIFIYEKLILKSPEKKSYFAIRIENLKK